MAKWTKEAIISLLRDNERDGYVKSMDIGMSACVMARRKFGSFGKACESAGVLAASDRPNTNVCSVDGCDLKPRTAKAKYCEKHYMRMRRRGTTEKLKRPERSVHTNGYVKVRAVGHPMSMSSGWAYEHRFAYYNKHGNGPFKCHWCRSVVTWSDLHIDHLNDDKEDNQVENLAASCAPCNIKRGSHKSAEWSRKNGKIYELNGEKKCVSEWARDIGISPQSIEWRIRNGWDLCDALTKPRGKFGPK